MKTGKRDCTKSKQKWDKMRNNNIVCENAILEAYVPVQAAGLNGIERVTKDLREMESEITKLMAHKEKLQTQLAMLAQELAGGGVAKPRATPSAKQQAQPFAK